MDEPDPELNLVPVGAARLLGLGEVVEDLVYLRVIRERDLLLVELGLDSLLELLHIVSDEFLKSLLVEEVVCSLHDLDIVK